MMKIIVDGFGGDHSPDEVVKGCRLAADEYDAKIAIAGNRRGLEDAASRCGVSLDGMEIIDAQDAITMEDSPSDVLRRKGCSMAVGLRALADGRGDAFLSAGNTGALVVGSRSIVKCIEGLKRPALAAILPSDAGCFMLLDVGANIECQPETLCQFALMGAVYMKKVLKNQNPRVGLVNIGTEDHKGRELERETYKLLKASQLNFIGNAEARDIPRGVCDVAVTDGFTGNIILKLTEGLGSLFVGNIKTLFKKSLLTKAAALMILPGIKEFRKKVDYTEYGGAPLMGLARPVIKAHGSSNAKAVKNAVRQAIAFSSEQVIETIRESRMKDLPENPAQ